jgi:hypothetical protein
MCVFVGCLGPEASETLRNTVMVHDTEKLLDRVDLSLINSISGRKGRKEKYSRGDDGEDDNDDTNNSSDDDEDENTDNADNDNDEPYDDENPNADIGSTSAASRLTESDFVTLIHQCRKRKWPNQVMYIYTFMKSLYEHGYPDRGQDNIPPQRQLKPSKLFFEAALDTYFSSSRPDDAWSFVNIIFGVDDNNNNNNNNNNDINSEAAMVKTSEDYSNVSLFHDVEFVTFLVKGFCHCNDLPHAVCVYNMFRSYPHCEQDIHYCTAGNPMSSSSWLNPACVPTMRLASGLMRACGADVDVGVNILLDLTNIITAPMTLAPTTVVVCGGVLDECVYAFSDEECVQLVSLLVESIAVLGKGQQAFGVGVCAEEQSALTRLFAHTQEATADMFTRIRRLLAPPNTNAALITSLLMCCVDTNDPISSHRLLHQLTHTQPSTHSSSEHTSTRTHTSSLLPRLPLFYSLITEALVSGISAPSQQTFNGALTSLPFDGSMKVGALKVIEHKQPLIALLMSVYTRVVCGWDTTVGADDCVCEQMFVSKLLLPCVQTDESEKHEKDVCMQSVDKYWLQYCRNLIQTNTTTNTNTPNLEDSTNTNSGNNNIDNNVALIVSKQAPSASAHKKSVAATLKEQKKEKRQANKEQHLNGSKERTNNNSSSNNNKHTQKDTHNNINSVSVSVCADSPALEEDNNDCIGTEATGKSVFAVNSVCELINQLTYNCCRCDEFQTVINTHTNADDPSININAALVCGLLYFQHLYARMLLVRHRTEKELLSAHIRAGLEYSVHTHLQTMCAHTHTGTHTDTQQPASINTHKLEVFVRNVFACVLQASSYLGLQKQGAKIMSIIFDCVKELHTHIPHTHTHTHTHTQSPTQWWSDLCAEQAIIAIQTYTPCFDIVREIQKSFDVMAYKHTPTSTHTGTHTDTHPPVDGVQACINCAIHNMVQRTEKIVRIIEFVKSASVFVSLTHTQRQLLEVYTVAAIVEECESTLVWSAVTTYLSAYKHLLKSTDNNNTHNTPTSDGNGSNVCVRADIAACVRMVRLLLSVTVHIDVTHNNSYVHTQLVTPLQSYAHIQADADVDCLYAAAEALVSVCASSSSSVRECVCKLVTLCRRILVRMECADIAEFRFLFESKELYQYEFNGNSEHTSANGHAVSVGTVTNHKDNKMVLADEDFMKLSLPACDVVMVQTLSDLHAAFTRLLADANTHTHGADGMVGIDCEWRPYGSNSVPTKVSLLQIATPVSVFLFDLMAIVRLLMTVIVRLLTTVVVRTLSCPVPLQSSCELC